MSNDATFKRVLPISHYILSVLFVGTIFFFIMAGVILLAFGIGLTSFSNEIVYYLFVFYLLCLVMGWIITYFSESGARDVGIIYTDIRGLYKRNGLCGYCNKQISIPSPGGKCIHCGHPFRRKDWTPEKEAKDKRMDRGMDIFGLMALGAMLLLMGFTCFHAMFFNMGVIQKSGLIEFQYYTYIFLFAGIGFTFFGFFNIIKGYHKYRGE